MNHKKNLRNVHLHSWPKPRSSLLWAPSEPTFSTRFIETSGTGLPGYIPVRIPEKVKKKMNNAAAIPNQNEQVSVAYREFYLVIEAKQDKRLVERFREIHAEIQPLVVAWRRSHEQIAPYLAQARALLRKAGCKGLFSQFLLSIGDFPRTTADRLADAWDAQQAPSVTPIDYGKLSSSEESEPVQAAGRSAIPPRYTMIEFPISREMEKSVLGSLGDIYRIHGKGYLAAKIVERAVVVPLLEAAEREARGRKKRPASVTTLPIQRPEKEGAND